MNAVRAGRQGTVPAASSMRATPNPRGSHPGGLGPHLTPSGFRWAFLRFPVCPPGSSPSPAVFWFPFVRRSPVVPFGRGPGSGCPSIPSGLPFPLSNVHASVAAGQFRQALVLGGTDQSHQFCRGGRLSQPCADATRACTRLGRTLAGQDLRAGPVPRGRQGPDSRQQAATTDQHEPHPAGVSGTCQDRKPIGVTGEHASEGGDRQSRQGGEHGGRGRSWRAAKYPGLAITVYSSMPRPASAIPVLPPAASSAAVTDSAARCTTISGRVRSGVAARRGRYPRPTTQS